MVERYNGQLEIAEQHQLLPELWAGRLTLSGVIDFDEAKQSHFVDTIVSPANPNIVRAALYAPDGIDFAVTSIVLKPAEEADEDRPARLAFNQLTNVFLRGLAEVSLPITSVEFENIRLCRYYKLGDISDSLHAAMGQSTHNELPDEQARAMFRVAHQKFLDQQVVAAYA